jgi:hypothetical protein
MCEIPEVAVLPTKMDTPSVGLEGILAQMSQIGTRAFRSFVEDWAISTIAFMLRKPQCNMCSHYNHLHLLGLINSTPGRLSRHVGVQNISLTNIHISWAMSNVAEFPPNPAGKRV